MGVQLLALLVPLWGFPRRSHLWTMELSASGGWYDLRKHQLARWVVRSLGRTSLFPSLLRSPSLTLDIGLGSHQPLRPHNTPEPSSSRNEDARDPARRLVRVRFVSELFCGNDGVGCYYCYDC